MKIQKKQSKSQSAYIRENKNEECLCTQSNGDDVIGKNEKRWMRITDVTGWKSELNNEPKWAALSVSLSYY